ncbi:hypothetical protein JK359_37600 [Streptomyces actinomycinicus]|uniref:TPM domain-containing protein n=1 Tax=Streptomyces actinomycinicus TaxID=1695166 RepID=A0A937ET28_9ACTN|nr:hypothetical protein [Streptomyces actinomycinicus]MBL1087590.1 hypothetical protein [Streptomyces actinomycinicus]
MTSSPIRARPRGSTAHIRARVVHAVLGVLAGAGWLVLPVMTVNTRDPVPVAPVGTAASSADPQQDETSTADLVLPLVAGTAAVTLAGYGYLRRTRRARTRTTPGIISARPPAPTPADSERQARAALRLADDCVRTSRDELSFVREGFGEKPAEPFTHALRAAETELSAAFAIWRRYEEGLPEDASARRQALVGVIGRCAEAGRRLDAEAGALDRLRGSGEQGVDGQGVGGPEGEARGAGVSLEVAEGRFRDVAVRTVTAQETLGALRERYAHSAAGSVTGYVEQAKDRLLFATARLNEARQAADAGDGPRAARQLRAGEGAVAQAEILVAGVERLAAQLREAAGLVPAALTGAEAELAAARGEGARTALTTGELHARLAYADGVLAAVREELTGGPYDPLDALRRTARAVERVAGTRPGVLDAAELLVARSAVAAAEEFVAVHRGAVGAEARARLAEAARELGEGSAGRADSAAGEARELAERDVRAHGTPYAGAGGDAAGLAGAVLGGILLAEDPDGGPPAGFGGPGTRSRHHLRTTP